MQRRNWRSWPGRIAEELNGVGGVSGIGGAILGAAGLTFFAGPTAIALATFGGIWFIGSAGYAVYQAVPPVRWRPEDRVGQIIPLSDLQNAHPAIPTLAILGLGQAGKTTLRNRLSFDAGRVDRTQSITAYIASLPTTPPKYLAILDGGGERWAQQFKIAEISDYVCIVVDHSISDDDVRVNDERVAAHAEFLKQVRHHLDESAAQKKGWVKLLLNKRDLWERASADEQARLIELGVSELEKWRQGRAQSATSARFSNERPNDVAELMTFFRQSVESRS